MQTVVIDTRRNTCIIGLNDFDDKLVDGDGDTDNAVAIVVLDNDDREGGNDDDDDDNDDDDIVVDDEDINAIVRYGIWIASSTDMVMINTLNLSEHDITKQGGKPWKYHK